MMFLLWKFFHSFSSMVQMSPLCAIIPVHIQPQLPGRFRQQTMSLDWPMNSPDLNPIEQIWDELGRSVRRNHAIHTVNDLAPAVLAEWAKLPVPFIQCYVNSMRCHITACIAQNGGHMRYRHISLNLQSLFVSWYHSNEFKPILLCNCVLQN